MAGAEESTGTKLVKAIAAAWSDRHFVVAAGILLVVTIGWNWAIAQLRWATRKEPVPWPQAVKVDPDCRATSFPDSFGQYVMVSEDGELGGKPDGRPDGEIVFSDEDLESLRINTSLDQSRLDERRSNWYISRIYRDSRVPQGGPFRYWRVEIFYYTGGLDKVPHVPERCLVAGGATLLPQWSGKVAASAPTREAGWREIDFNRTGYELSDRRALNVTRHVQYYTFSLNGKPEDSWEMVRLKLTKPWVRYCYFAKIQVAPYDDIQDVDRADKAAREFISAFLPAAISMLPMPSDIEKRGKE